MLDDTIVWPGTLIITIVTINSGNYRWHCPQEITCPLHGLSVIVRRESVSRGWSVRSFEIPRCSRMRERPSQSNPAFPLALFPSFSLLPLHSAFLRRHYFDEWREKETERERERKGKKKEAWVGHVSLHFSPFRRITRELKHRGPGNFVFGGRVGRRFHRGGPRSIRSPRRTTSSQRRTVVRNRLGFSFASFFIDLV